MNIHLHRLDDAFHFELTNDTGNVVHVDASPAAGGKGQGARPMELVAMGLAGCSSIDVLSILEKQRQVVERYDVALRADRATDAVPAVFTAMHLHFIVDGAVEADKLRRAIELSIDKYCSVSKMLEKTATITYSFTLNGETYD